MGAAVEVLMAMNQAAAAVGSLTDSSARSAERAHRRCVALGQRRRGGQRPMLKASSPSNHDLMLPV
jgi:hypothetical protein